MNRSPSNNLKVLLAVLVLYLLPVTVVAADQVVKTGEFSASYPLAELTDAETIESLGNVIAADAEITWEIYVPEHYSAAKPAGVIVNISPTASGKMPRRWKQIMDQHNLIWIGANRSGNPVMTRRRILYAALAPVYIDKSYAIDPDRIYVSGLSGGGRVSSIVAVELPMLFKGAIYICGVNPPREEQPVRLEQIQNNRFVFLTGSRDFNEAETKKVYGIYKKLKVPGIKLMVIPHMTHRNPDADKFEEAIVFLDSRGQM